MNIKSLHRPDRLLDRSESHIIACLLAEHSKDKTLTRETVSSIHDRRFAGGPTDRDNDKKPPEASPSFDRRHRITPKNNSQNGSLAEEPKPTTKSSERGRRPQEKINHLANKIVTLGSPKSEGRQLVSVVETPSRLKTGVAVLLLAVLVALVALAHFKVCAELQRLWNKSGLRDRFGLGRYAEKLKVGCAAAAIVCGRRRSGVVEEEEADQGPAGGQGGVTNRPLLVTGDSMTSVTITSATILTETPLH